VQDPQDASRAGSNSLALAEDRTFWVARACYQLSPRQRWSYYLNGCQT